MAVHVKCHSVCGANNYLFSCIRFPRATGAPSLIYCSYYPTEVHLVRSQHSSYILHRIHKSQVSSFSSSQFLPSSGIHSFLLSVLTLMESIFYTASVINAAMVVQAHSHYYSSRFLSQSCRQLSLSMLSTLYLPSFNHKSVKLLCK